MSQEDIQSSQTQHSCQSDKESQQQLVFSKKKISKKKKKNKNQIIINISDCQYPVVAEVARSLGWKRQKNIESNDWDVFWTDNVVQPEKLLRMQPYQKINHFPGMFNLSRKNYLGKILMKMRKKFPDVYNFFPLTWMLPVEYRDLKAYYNAKETGKARTFIVKPQAMSQGKGIYLTRKLEDIDSLSHCVVQRYMHKPYLIDGLKFDLRIYVLLISVDPLRVYMFKEGFARFATEKYEAPTKQNMQSICMHLTNYAINKDSSKFVFNKSQKDMSKGHKRSLTSVLQYLKQHGVKTNELMQKIKSCILKTIISQLPVLCNQYRLCQPQNYAGNMCFELLGFDIMLNQAAKPILLQINYTPSFNTDTPLDHYIKYNYIKDTLNLLNINLKNKKQLIKSRKQACKQRVMTGKQLKLTLSQKQLARIKAQHEKDQLEQKNLGGFIKLYPNQQSSKYQPYLQQAQQLFNSSLTSGNKKIKKINHNINNINKLNEKSSIKQCKIQQQIKKQTLYKCQEFSKNKNTNNDKIKNIQQSQQIFLEIQNHLQTTHNSKTNINSLQIKKLQQNKINQRYNHEKCKSAQQILCDKSIVGSMVESSQKQNNKKLQIISQQNCHYNCNNESSNRNNSNSQKNSRTKTVQNSLNSLNFKNTQRFKQKYTKTPILLNTLLINSEVIPQHNFLPTNQIKKSITVQHINKRNE